MGLQMFVERSSVVENGVANDATEMTRAHVLLQLGRPGKGPAAVLALVVQRHQLELDVAVALLLLVVEHVFAQLPLGLRLRFRLETGKGIDLKLRLDTVDADVVGKRGRRGKRSRTVLAVVGPVLPDNVSVDVGDQAAASVDGTLALVLNLLAELVQVAAAAANLQVRAENVPPPLNLLPELGLADGTRKTAAGALVKRRRRLAQSLLAGRQGIHSVLG